MNGFTEKHIADWRAYEKVRKKGLFNMFDPRARRVAGLSAEAYGFCMRNYSALRIAAENKGDAAA